MDHLLRADLDAYDALLSAVRDAAAGYLAGLGAAPAVPRVPPPPPAPLPDRGVGAEEAVRRLARDWLPAMAATAGPRFWGYVTGGTTPAALAGDWLTAAIDQNPASDEGAAATLARRTAAWIGELLGLGPDQAGVFVTGATMANVAGLALAREWAGRRHGVDVNETGLGGLPRPRVLAGCAHSSIGKAASILGLGRASVIPVPTLPGREAVDPAALEALLRDPMATAVPTPTPASGGAEPGASAGAEPGPAAIVVASAGTVNTGDVDDLRALAELRDRHGFWLHVDGAFGAFAALAPSHAHLLAGIDAADSITVDLHKWMNVPYDSALSFTRHPDLRPAVFGNVGAYLTATTTHDNADGAAHDNAAASPLVHLGPENSQRLRALPAYAALTAYGRIGHADIVARNLAQASRFAALVEAMSGAHLLAPARLNIVCFGTDRPVPDVLAALGESGQALLTPTTYAGRPAIRAAFSNWRTTDADVTRVADALRDVLR